MFVRIWHHSLMYIVELCHLNLLLSFSGVLTPKSYQICGNSSALLQDEGLLNQEHGIQPPSAYLSSEFRQ